MTVQNIVKIGKIYHSSWSVFMTDNTPSGVKKHCETERRHLDS